jgi:hypothetical protein
LIIQNIGWLQTSAFSSREGEHETAPERFQSCMLAGPGRARRIGMPNNGTNAESVWTKDWAQDQSRKTFSGKG